MVSSRDFHILRSLPSIRNREYRGLLCIITSGDNDVAVAHHGDARTEHIVLVVSYCILAKGHVLRIEDCSLGPPAALAKPVYPFSRPSQYLQQEYICIRISKPIIVIVTNPHSMLDGIDGPPKSQYSPSQSKSDQVKMA